MSIIYVQGDACRSFTSGSLSVTFLRSPLRSVFFELFISSRLILANYHVQYLLGFVRQPQATACADSWGWTLLWSDGVQCVDRDTCDDGGLDSLVEGES